MKFNDKFSKTAILDFLQNQFLPEDFEVCNESIDLNLLSFRPERILDATLAGEVPSLSLKVYVIRHKSEHDPRVSLSNEIFKLMRNQSASRALAVFYSDSSENYRLSLVTINFSLKSGSAKVDKEYSNPRRYSFFLGPDAKTKTPEYFLLKKGRIAQSDYEDLRKRFSVEVVTEEFYHEVANWYFWALKHVRFTRDAEAQANGRNIALIRFITRLIFVWFMKQKKLVGADLFEQEKLSAYLKDLSSDGDSYYKAILQNLFFATLNTPVKERDFRTERRYKGINDDYMDHRFYRHHDLFNNPDDMLSIFKDIPFLNGGLFECLDKRKNDESNDTGQEIRLDGFSDVKSKQPHLPNFLFFGEEIETDELNEDYNTKSERYKVKGIIRILEAYNFTIDENSPIDEEIALDPELLGRVFENLLASYNPETSATARKSTGSYYTPRDIVDYMVSESLKEYFRSKTAGLKFEDFDKKLEIIFSYEAEGNPFSKTETAAIIEAIDNLKVLDPAVGSGAFPMGMLQKLVFLLSRLDPHNQEWEKRQIEAVERSVLDAKTKKETIQRIEENFRENELNYGRKLYLIQKCLYGVDIQPIAIEIARLRFFISLLVDEKVNARKDDNFGIEPLPNLETKLIAANTLVGLEKDETLMPMPEILALEKELFDIRARHFSESNRARKESLKKKDKEKRQELQKAFKDQGCFHKYIEQVVAWSPYGTGMPATWFDSEWMFGVNNGFDIIIANPPYISHDKITLKSHLKLAYTAFEPFADLYCYFLEFAAKVLSPNGLVCFITSNSYLRADYGKPLRGLLASRCVLHSLINIEDSQMFDSAIVNTAVIIAEVKSNVNVKSLCSVVNKAFDPNSTFEQFVIQNRYMYEQSDFSERPWTLQPPKVKRLCSKIEKSGKTLEQLGAKIRLGLATGANEAFVIDDIVRARLIKQDKKSAEIIRPVLRGRDIQRYTYEFSNLYILLTRNGISVKENYPAVYEHLNSFGADFKKRGAQGQHWTNLRACAFFDDFKEEKIIWIELSDQGRFALCSEEVYLLNSAYFLLPPKSIEINCLLAILNSRLIQFYLEKNAETSGMGTCRWINNYVKDFPIPPVQDGKPLVKIVGKILDIKRADSAADVSVFEREIDQHVYKLYKLTDEEIAIVEEK